MLGSIDRLALAALDNQGGHPYTSYVASAFCVTLIFHDRDDVVDDTGTVNISSPKGEGVDKAETFVRGLTEEVEVGKIYLGKITKWNDRRLVAANPGVTSKLPTHTRQDRSCNFAWCLPLHQIPPLPHST